MPLPIPATPLSNQQAFLRLHISVLLAGFTGVLGKLIEISEGMLVWYRMLFTFLIFWGILLAFRRFERIALRDFLRVGGVGVILCLHWLFFYGSIKASNISIGVICFALIGFFTAVLEPLILHKRFSAREMLFSMFSLLGVALIFSFDTRYRLGIGLGVFSSLLAALFTICNKRVCANHSSGTLLLYQMLGGFLFLSCILPFYVHYFDITYLVPHWQDLTWLLCLVLFCTIVMYFLQIQALRVISAFTVNLTYNLEPVYSIVIAIAFMGEARELGPSFYVGLSLILLSVGLQTWYVTHQRMTIPSGMGK